VEEAHQASVLGMPPYRIEPGRAHPLGATPDAHGVNFSIYCGQATSVELLLFDERPGVQPVQDISLDPTLHNTFMFWHVYVIGARPGMHYAYRVAGPTDPAPGARYNPNKVLIDPYARAISMTLWNRAAACGPDDNLATAMHGIVADVASYDWEGDQPLNLPMRESIIYELHLAGFTKSPTSGCQYPGAFAGLVEKIPYLQRLGITAVELMPICHFDAQEIDRLNPIDGRPLTNFWGYNTIGFFSPHRAYYRSPDDATHIHEFRDMVKALHRAGIEVLLDMVFNHTGEGDHLGPTISFKGLDNAVYYYLRPDNPQYYLDFSGCGNTVKCNHPIVEKLIVDCLEFWVKEMHVDGFRFDEGSILSRGEDGAPMAYPPVIWAIELSDVLADVKVIAEAWDAAGLNEVGYFPGHRWAEWNGRYRDEVRRFVRGDPGIVAAIASRLAGSSDVFRTTGALPISSVNFVTCHDGFTLNDLVSYNQKHNEANGAGNRDGSAYNLSWNCGAEGATDDPEIEMLRERQMKNYFTLLLLSQGVPMLLAGDEVRRTQQGNNNAYCQDNETSWFDWTLVERHGGLFRFVSTLITFRKRHHNLHRARFLTGAATDRGRADIAWHGCRLLQPDWNDPQSRVLAFTLGATVEDDTDIHVMLNMDTMDLPFETPSLDGGAWYRVLDTALLPPHDIVDPGFELLCTQPNYVVRSRSIAVLIAGSTPPA